MPVTKILGLIGGLLSMIAYIPYIRSMFRGPTQPQRSTWLIWIFSDSLVLASYYSLGATDGVWLTVAYVIGTTLVFIFSIKRGVGGTEPIDIACFVLAIASGFLWWYTSNPQIALLTNLGIVLIGIVPGIPKIWNKPYSEDLLAFTFWGSGTICCLLSVLLSDNNGFNMYIAPVVFLCLQTTTGSIMLIRRRFVPRPVLATA